MAYTTEAIVREESPFKNTSHIVAAYITRAIAEADAIIDAHIGSVYSLPLSETPTIIQNISTSLTIYELLKDQNLNIEIASGVNVTAMVEDAIALLEKIQKRKMKLYDSAGDELTTSGDLNPAFYPTQTSSDDKITDPQFTMAKQY